MIPQYYMIMVGILYDYDSRLLYDYGSFIP